MAHHRGEFLRRIAIALGIAFAVALGSLGWTFLQRHDRDMQFSRHLRARQRHRGDVAAEDTGSSVKIVQFYARAGEMTNAESNLICYSVRNARSLQLDPPVENLSPSFLRCFSVEPKQDTTYTLIAEGLDGSRETASCVVKVKPAPPHIQFVAVSHAEILRGDAVTVCYGVDHAKGVRLDPIGWPLPAVEKKCTRFYPKSTLNYTLVAFDAEGRTDREKFSVRVK